MLDLQSKISTSKFTNLPNTLTVFSRILSNKKGKILLAIGTLTFGTILNFTVLSRASFAQQTCQCVGYVQQRLGISLPVRSAKDAVSVLPSRGFQRISSPEPGAVVVMQPNFPGSDRTHGHIGIVASVNNGRIAVRSANQTSNSVFREAGCNNVSVVNFGTPVTGRSDISFWRQTSGISR